MIKLLDFIGNLFTSIVGFLKTSVIFFLAFFESILEVVGFAVSPESQIYLPAFVLPVFVLLVVYAVIKIMINRQ